MTGIFKEVLRDFEKDRLAAQRKSEARMALLYQRLPRVAEIDRKMSNLSLDLAKMTLRREVMPSQIEAMRLENAALQEERAGLLYENGYDEEFFTDIYKCILCQDKGIHKDKHCKCLKQRLISRYFEMSNLGKVLENENFDSFDMNFYSDLKEAKYGISPRENMERIWSVAIKFAENFGENFQNLFMYGNTGLGKTFLSNCIAFDLLNKGHTVLYTTAAQLFRQVEDARFNKGQGGGEAMMAAAYEVDLLIFDDLGTEFSTTVTTSELFNFINTRLLTKKPTIISTNLAPNDLENLYSDRITSRIFGEYTLLHFFGEDIRIAKKHGLF